MKKERTAAERYQLSKRLMYLLLACLAIFVGLIIFDLVTKTPISSSATSFICINSCCICANSVHMNKAAQEMKEETEKENTEA